MTAARRRFARPIRTTLLRAAGAVTIATLATAGVALHSFVNSTPAGASASVSPSIDSDLRNYDPVPTAVPAVQTGPAVLPAFASSAPAPMLQVSAARVRRLTSPDSALNVPVGVYSDCSGQTPLFRNAAAIYTCVHDVTYFVGHNPGVFTPLMNFTVGSRITWWDDSGIPHAWKIVAVRTVQQANGVPPKVSADVIAQFQTCVTLDGSVDRILDAAPLNPQPAAVSSSAPASAPSSSPAPSDPSASQPPPAPSPTPNPYPWSWIPRPPLPGFHWQAP